MFCRILQMSFTCLLGEDNELVQDVTSLWLGIIFSISDENSQTELSTLLLEQLTDGNKGKVIKVSDSEDTKIIEEGTGKTPTGANLSTYKELCSLAPISNRIDLLIYAACK